MNKSKIEWCDYTINPVKGSCPNSQCPLFTDKCYARRMYKRFKWNPEIRFEDDVLYPGLPLPGADGDKYFIGSTIELFGDWVKGVWLIDIFDFVKLYPKRTFIFLTKRPENLIKWSPFPDNCWVGASATNEQMYWDATRYLHGIRASVKFLSFEPLLDRVMCAGSPYKIEGMPLVSLNEPQHLRSCGISWVIIGAQSPYSKKTAPKWEWVKEIIDACDKAGVPVFLKNNLGLAKYDSEGFPPFYKLHPTGTMKLRQEYPVSPRQGGLV